MSFKIEEGLKEEKETKWLEEVILVARKNAGEARNYKQKIESSLRRLEKNFEEGKANYVFYEERKEKLKKTRVNYILYLEQNQKRISQLKEALKEKKKKERKEKKREKKKEKEQKKEKEHKKEKEQKRGKEQKKEKEIKISSKIIISWVILGVIIFGLIGFSYFGKERGLVRQELGLEGEITEQETSQEKISLEGLTLQIKGSNEESKEGETTGKKAEKKEIGFWGLVNKAKGFFGGITGAVLVRPATEGGEKLGIMACDYCATCCGGVGGYDDGSFCYGAAGCPSGFECGPSSCGVGSAELTDNSLACVASSIEVGENTTCTGDYNNDGTVSGNFNLSLKYGGGGTQITDTCGSNKFMVVGDILYPGTHPCDSDNGYEVVCDDWGANADNKQINWTVEGCDTAASQSVTTECVSGDTCTIDATDNIEVTAAGGGPTSCGSISSDTTLTQSVSGSGSCYTIAASGITLDCGGYWINYATGGGTGVYGVNASSYNRTRIKNCNINESGSGSGANYGIYLSSSNHTVIENNNITTRSTGSDGIYIAGSPFGGDSINNTMEDNNISLAGGSSSALNIVGTKVTDNTIRSNVLGAFGSSSYGVRVDRGIDNLIESNEITGEEGIILLQVSGNQPSGNVFLNNNITATGGGAKLIDDRSSSSASNYLIYNNSDGDVRWTNATFLTNLTINNTDNELKFGESGEVFIGSNIAALNASDFEAGFGGINSTANITFYGLTAPSIDNIFKKDGFPTSSADVVQNGSACSDCIKISYSGGILKFNVTSFSGYAGNNPPNTTEVKVNATSLNNYTTDNLTCWANVSDADGGNIWVNYSWYNSSKEVVGLRGQTGPFTESSFNNVSTVLSGNTSVDQNWTCSVKGYDGTDYEAEWNNASSNVTIAAAAAANTAPTAPVGLLPTNGSSDTDRTPTLTWNTSDDDEGDPVSYNLVIDDNSGFGSPEVNVSGLTNTSPKNMSYTVTTELDVDTTYFWEVRANDTTEYGEYSGVMNFTVDSYVAISFLTSSVEFGTMANDETNDTTDDYPRPFLLENAGNVLVNVTVTGGQLFTQGGFPSWNFSFRIEENETGSFNVSNSTTNWAQVPESSSRVDVFELNWTDNNDTFEMELNVTVPSDESAGVKNSTIIFTANYG